MLLVLLSSLAFGLDCEFVSFPVPADATQGVATSASVRYWTESDAATDTARIVDALGAEVPTTRTIAVQGRQRVVTLTPTAPLAAGADFELRASPFDVEEGQGTFSTGAGPDVDPPTGGGIAEVRTESSDGDWGPTREVIITFTPPTDADGVYYELQIAENDAFTDATTILGRNSTVVAGISLCSETWPEVPLDTPLFVRGRAVDLSGNASDWWTHDDSVRVRDGLPIAKGCDNVGGAALGGWALLLVGLLGVRRRTR